MSGWKLAALAVIALVVAPFYWAWRLVTRRLGRPCKTCHGQVTLGRICPQCGRRG